MKCQQIAELLLYDKIGELSESERKMLEEHMQSCANCRGAAYLTQLENEVLAEKPAVPPIADDFIRRTMQKLPQAGEFTGGKKVHSLEQAQSARRRSKMSFWMRTAAVFLLLCGGGWYFQQHIAGNIFSTRSQQVAEENTPAVVAEVETTMEAAENRFDATVQPTALIPEQEVKMEVTEVQVASAGMAAEPVQAEIPVKTKPVAIPKRNIPLTENTAGNNVVLAVASAEEATVPLTNPYQNLPASPYTSAVATYYQTSRSIRSLSEPAHEMPDVVLGSIPDMYRLAGFSRAGERCVFDYQDDQSATRLLFTVVPYDSSQDEGNTASRLITCGDRTYQVCLEGEGGCLTTEDVTHILSTVMIQQHEQQY